jgi:hypothetical protein
VLYSYSSSPDAVAAAADRVCLDRSALTHADAGGEFETQKQCDCAARYRDAPGGRRDADPVTKCDCDTSPRQHADSNDVAGE